MTDLLDTQQLAAVEAVVDTALAGALAEVEAIVAVERGDIDQPFWYVRIEGEVKKHFSAELTLGQRTLTIESYFMPEPEEHREQVYAQLLARNRSMRDLAFVIGAENAVYLRGHVDNRHLDAEIVDRLLAAVYDHTEQYFLPAMRLGFASRFAG